jgi:hypothetical protein
VITGFNTDVEHNGKTYHVQTEDKGLETPFILTLVYDGGTILASRRLPYDDLFTGGFREKDLAARLQRQHTLICAAISAGRIGELVTTTNGNGKKQKKAGPVRSKRKPVKETARQIGKAETDIVIKVIDAKGEKVDEPPVVEDVKIIDTPIELPGEAIEIVSDMAGKERPEHDRLCLEFVNETAFRSGETKSVTFMLSRGNERKVIGNAKILVKILGANIRPQIFHSITDTNGLAKMDLEVPEFSGGRAAVLVRASVGGDEIELRRAILQS